MEFVALIVIIVAVILVQNHLYRKSGLKNVQYTCKFSSMEAYEGDEIELIEELSNEKLLPVPWIKSEISAPKWLDFAGTQSVITDKTRFVSSFFMLKSYHKVLRKWKVKCLKRGVFRLNTVVLVASDLLGNVTMSKPVAVNIEITVLPKAIDFEEFSILSNHLMGEWTAKRHLLSDPFLLAGVREYQDGDALNKINWLATAKEKQIMVHQNDYTTSQSVAVILNIQSRDYDRLHISDEAEIENCIRFCASCFVYTQEAGIPVKLLTNAPLQNSGEPVESNEFAGSEHVLNLLRILAKLQLVSVEGFDSFLNSIYDRIASTDIFLVTSYVDEPVLDFARKKQEDGAHVKLFVLGTVPADCDVEIYDLSNCFHQAKH